jgi:hypothetical protein
MDDNSGGGALSIERGGREGRSKTALQKNQLQIPRPSHPSVCKSGARRGHRVAPPEKHRRRDLSYKVIAKRRAGRKPLEAPFGTQGKQDKLAPRKSEDTRKAAALKTAALCLNLLTWKARVVAETVKGGGDELWGLVFCMLQGGTTPSGGCLATPQTVC